jgi:two-component system, NarL family, nitrate/nitrite response regulator NarL
MRCVTVVITDHHPVLLEGLKNVLGAQHDFKVVARCSDAASCIEAIRNLVPDVAIIVVLMPDRIGLEILAIASTENLSTRLVFFTSSVADRELIIAAAAGAYSVILTDVAPEILVGAIAGIEEINPFTKSTDGKFLVKDANVLTLLTEREREIMRLVSEGLSNKAIARRLNISDGTIKVHLHHIYQKLEINNRTVLARLAITNNRADTPAGDKEIPDENWFSI